MEQRLLLYDQECCLCQHSAPWPALTSFCLTYRTVQATPSHQQGRRVTVNPHPEIAARGIPFDRHFLEQFLELNNGGLLRFCV